MNTENTNIKEETEISTSSSNFIRDIIDRDLETNKYDGRVVTRFPPEPNGYLHIGHTKAICLSFGIAKDYKGPCHLRFDDTNPIKEEQEYIDAIIEDIKWLGFDWGENLFYASDYFDMLYEYAIELIKKNVAYVCDLSPEEIREYRGTLTSPGKESPFRNRSIEENLDLFERMKNGEFKNGERTLRAKIDMSSGNLNMRDPVFYRILHAHHHRSGDKWCIYPMYDYTHCVSDSIERITHSLCTLEFEDHRPLYDWFLEQLEVYRSQQIEFARLNLTSTVMSKRKLLKLVKENYVDGWDDPRMPTISGLRRRGFTPESIKDFCDRIGVAKANSTIDIALLNHCLREDLNKKAKRVMAVLYPLKLVITNYPDDKVEEFEAINNQEDESMGKRLIPFCKELFIEQSDFMLEAPKKFHRLSPGKEVRLMHAYYIKCEKVIMDEESGEIKEIHCTYDPDTKGGWSNDGRKVKGTLHWVSARHALDAEVRLYESLLTAENTDEMDAEKDFTDYINPDSKKILTNCKVEPSLKDSEILSNYQFLRQGYFCKDKDNGLVFNQTVSLKDSWAKIANKQ
ncbi:MAG: glutamine--tRNA ligase/YqeY domain fusion protein [Pseudomonadota bacterium]